MGRTRPDSIALQLWTIRDALAADADEALRRVREAGFEAVEVAPPPPGLGAEALGELLDRHGLAVVSIHGELPTAANIGDWERLARRCRCAKIIWHGWPRDPRFDSLAGVREVVAAANEAAALAAAHGLRLGLHNHWWEFEPLGGERPIRLLHAGLHPAIFWQLDIYWARVGGIDPAAAVAGLGARLDSLHWKDGPAAHGEPMAPLGRGVLDLPAVARSLPRPVDWVVELDECASDPLEAARASRVYLEGLSDRPGDH